MIMRMANSLKRKARLFLCASCRQIWSHIPKGPARAGVAVAERFADGHATEAERAAA